MTTITNNETSSSSLLQLKGLVLAGGKSSRLGQDKSKIKWNGKEQMFYVAEHLQSFCNEVFISRRNNEESYNIPFKIIPDNNNFYGPIAGILSAFEQFPQAAWLVVACDLPLFNYEAVSFLVNQRDCLKVATSYESPRDGSPEPLAAIWEPAAFNILKTAVNNGFTCPRKILMQNNIKLVTPANSDFLKNVNTKEDMESVRKIFSLI